MTEKEAAKLTRYFGEGVKARIWRFSDKGKWAIEIDRDEGRVYYHNLNALKRRVFEMIRNGRLEIYKEDWEYETDSFTFRDAESAEACLREVKNAVIYVQADGRDDRWLDLTMNVFDDAITALSAPSDAVSETA